MSEDDKRPTFKDKAKEKTKELADKAATVAKDGVIKAIQALDADQMAEIIQATATKQDEINAALLARGAHFQLQGIQMELAVPPKISMGVIRLDVDQPPAGDASSGG